MKSEGSTSRLLCTRRHNVGNFIRKQWVCQGPGGSFVSWFAKSLRGLFLVPTGCVASLSLCYERMTYVALSLGKARSSVIALLSECMCECPGFLPLSAISWAVRWRRDTSSHELRDKPPQVEHVSSETWSHSVYDISKWGPGSWPIAQARVVTH